MLEYEFERLNKQRCAYCSGWGHSGNDCPTDSKIDQLRGGVKEQTQVLIFIRKQARAEANMNGVSGFSLISADPRKTRPRSKRALSLDNLDEPANLYRKRIRY